MSTTQRLSSLLVATMFIALIALTAAPSPALAGGATQISGVGVYAEGADCNDPEGVNDEGVAANYALVLDGDLKGCLYTFVETARSSPSGTYLETGYEVFVGSVASGGSGTFVTTYRFEAKYEDLSDPATEIFGRCQHPILKGSGTGVFEGVTGILFFTDVIEAGNDPYFPYRGHLRW